MQKKIGSIVAIVFFKGEPVPLSVNGKNYEAGKGDLLVLAPDMILEYDDCGGSDTVMITASVDLVMELPSPFDTDIISAARRMPLVRPSDREMSVISNIHSIISDVNSSEEGTYSKEIVKSLTFGVIYKIGEIYHRILGEMPSGDSLSDEALSDRFFRLLAIHFRTERKVKFYAGKMALTPKYLSKAIRDATGKSVREWVNDAIILEIKNLLKTTDMTVLQISEELDFCTPSAFVQFFRQHTGTTPFRYRHSSEW